MVKYFHPGKLATTQYETCFNAVCLGCAPAKSARYYFNMIVEKEHKIAKFSRNKNRLAH